MSAPRWWSRHAGLRDVLLAALVLACWCGACVMDAVQR